MEELLKKINKSAIKFLAPLNPEDTYKSILKEAQKIVGSDYGTILLNENGCLKRVYATTEELYEVKIRKKGFSYSVYKKNKAEYFDTSKLASIHPKLIEMGIKSVVMLPLSYRKHPIGVLTLQFKKKEDFKEKDLQIFTLFASLASMAIRKTQLNSELKEALETRDLFIALAAHELRTPMTSINGYIDLMNRRLIQNKAIENTWVKSLSNEASRLTHLIEELLEVNKVKSGKLVFDFRNCHLSDVITQAIHRFKFTFPTHKIIYTNKVTQDVDTVRGDFNKLLQAFNNLLDNAAKHSSVDKPIFINYLYIKNKLVIEIQDSGKGIAPHDIPNVFKVFYKAEDNLKEGMGLGLYITKNILDKHNAAIKVTSELNKGTTFILTFHPQK